MAPVDAERLLDQWFRRPPILAQHRACLFHQRVQQGRPDDRVPVIQRSCLAQRFEAFAKLPVEAQFLAALQPLFRLRGARQGALRHTLQLGEFLIFRKFGQGRSHQFLHPPPLRFLTNLGIAAAFEPLCLELDSGILRVNVA